MRIVALIWALIPVLALGAQDYQWLHEIVDEATELVKQAERINGWGGHPDYKVLERFDVRSFPRAIYRMILKDDVNRAIRLKRGFFDTESMIRQRMEAFKRLALALEQGDSPTARKRLTHSYLNLQAATRFYFGVLRDTYLIDGAQFGLLVENERVLVEAMTKLKQRANSIFLRFTLPEDAPWRSECAPIRTNVADPRKLEYEAFPFYSFPKEDETGRPLDDYDYSNHLTGRVILPSALGPDAEDPEAWNRRWNGR